MVNPIPDGHHNVTPTLTVKGASNAIEFYKKDMTLDEVKKAGEEFMKQMKQQ